MTVSTDQRRAHVTMPVELAEEIDALVGRRGRSRFLEEAAAEKLQILRRVAAFERATATPTDTIPEWDTRESTAEWPRELRQDRDLGDRYDRSHMRAHGEVQLDAESPHRRVHVVMPEDTVDAIDAIVGKRRRSQFITETVEAELRRRRLSAALAEMDGALADFDIPGWETPEAAAAWVRALRDGAEVAQPSESESVA